MKKHGEKRSAVIGAYGLPLAMGSSRPVWSTISARIRELYFQVERNYPKRPRGLDQLAKSSADAVEGEPFERDSRAPETAN